jgi:predicted phage-related endonuclease
METDFNYEPAQVVHVTWPSTNYLFMSSEQRSIFRESYHNTVAHHETLEWHRLRKKCIGGSDVPVLYGEASHREAGGREIVKTVEDLIAEKVKGIKSFEGNIYSYMGSMMEPVLAQHVMNNLPNETMFFDKERVYHHYEQDYLTTSIDALSIDQAGQYTLWEFKTTSYSQMSKVKLAAAKKHELQVRHALGVLGLDKAKILYLVGGNKFFLHTISHDETWWRNHLDKCNEFKSRLEEERSAWEDEVKNGDF